MWVQQSSLYDALQEKLDHVSFHGHYFSCMCPFDEHSKPALLVYEDGKAHCMSCDRTWTLEQVNNKISKESVHYTVLKKEIETPFIPWKTWEKKFGTWESLAVEAHMNAMAFPSLVSGISKRLNRDVIKDGRMGWLDSFFFFPVFDIDKKFVDLVVRHKSVKQYAIRPRVERNETHLYSASWERVYSSNKVVIPFGIFDMWTVHLAGYATLTGITGKAMDASLLSDIRKKIYIIPDWGEMEAALKLKSGLGWRGEVVDIQWPDGCKDTNDVYQKFGIEKVKELLCHSII